MLNELKEVRTFEDLEGAAISLLDSSAFRTLQEEMVSADIAFNRSDYWPEDVLERKTRSIPAARAALMEVLSESTEPRLLHVLQMVGAIAPGTSNDVKRFLKRVTFG